MWQLVCKKTMSDTVAEKGMEAEEKVEKASQMDKCAPFILKQIVGRLEFY